MKKLFLVLFILPFLIVGCQNKPKQQQEKPVDAPEIVPGDFRNAKWGDLRQQVKNSESSDFVDEDDKIMAYKGKVANLESLIFYYFTNDSLYQSVYKITEKHTNANEYISDFKTLKDLLTEKYGEPKHDKTVWKSSLYKDNVNHYGLAVSSGHLVYAAKWQTESTDIQLILGGDNFECSLAIFYDSRKYKNMIEKEEKKQKLNDL